MFTGLTFNFTEKLCKCDALDPAWCINHDSSLTFWCKICKVRMTIPRTELRATLNFDAKLPLTKPRLKPEPETKSVQKDNVFYLQPKK